jgi:hypothetical protein
MFEVDPQYALHEEPPIWEEFGTRFVVLTVLTEGEPREVPLLEKVTVPVGAWPPVLTSAVRVVLPPSVMWLLLDET